MSPFYSSGLLSTITGILPIDEILKNLVTLDALSTGPIN